MVVCHHGFGLMLTTYIKVLILTIPFFGNQKSLSIAFHTQIDGLTKRQNYTIEVYFRVFVNMK